VAAQLEGQLGGGLADGGDEADQARTAEVGGGTAQADRRRNPVAPAYWVMGVAAVGLATVLTVRSARPGELPA
jgi:hypothetical protein